MATQFNFGKIKQNMLSIDIAKQLGDIVASGFDDSFKEEGFDNVKWEDVKRRISGANLYKPTPKDPSKKTRPILQGLSGKLRRAVSNSSQSGYKINNLTYVLVVNNEYAQYHNEGTNKIPKRKFIGVSTKTNKKILMFISSKINKIWEI